MELSGLDEVTSTTRPLALSPRIVVASISLGTTAQPAMIVTREQAARVIDAIDGTVGRVRELDALAKSD
jgi:hypothetical protein